MKNEIPQICFIFLLFLLSHTLCLCVPPLFLSPLKRTVWLLVLSTYKKWEFLWSLLSMFTLYVWLSNFRFIRSLAVRPFIFTLAPLRSAQSSIMIHFSFRFVPCYNVALWKVNILIVFMTRRHFSSTFDTLFIFVHFVNVWLQLYTWNIWVFVFILGLSASWKSNRIVLVRLASLASVLSCLAQAPSPKSCVLATPNKRSSVRE